MSRSGFNLNTVIAMVLVFGALSYFITSWSEQPGSMELQQGQRIMYQVMGAETLREAGFYQAYPAARPSDFVNFARTRQGQRLWPQTTKEFRDKQVPGASGDPGRVLQPVDLSFAAESPDQASGKQIVYVPLDETGEIEVRGYERPDAEPVFVYTWEFPTDAGRVQLR
jgi:hypothetical protein